MTSKRITSQINLMGENPVIIFFHLPKTGGTTLSWMARSRHMRAFGRGARLETEKKFCVEPMELYREQQAVRYSYDMVIGHCYYGIHTLLRKPALYIAMVREPIDRALSHYYYIKGRTDHLLHRDTRKLSLLKFVNSERFHPGLSNVQTKMLSGLYTKIDQYGIKKGPGDKPSSPEEELECAKCNVDRHFLYGVMYQFDRSLRLFQRVLGWETLTYERRKISKRPPMYGMSPRVLVMLNEMNTLDIILYDYVRESFEDICKEEGL